MAKRYRKSTRTVQRQYRSRRTKYEKYLAQTKDKTPKSFKEWNDPYRTNKLLRKLFKIYKKRFAKRIKSSRYGFWNPEEIPNFKIFKDLYIRKRNDLKLDVEEGFRDRVGSVVNEIINDQAYEISSNKAKAIYSYLISEEMPLLAEKGIAEQYLDEEGKIQYKIIKPKNLELLVREGSFLREEIGFWDMTSDLYHKLRDQGYTPQKAREEVGKTYFNSGPKRKG